tara:strand:- start:522 stop:1523 length:1002 start_codon:yes stop_codon:yes gene_type:complete
MIKKILVTGSEGFIGSHLVEFLVEKKYQINALCLYNSFDQNGWLDFLDPKIKKKINLIKGDIRDFKVINSAIEGCQCVIHLASLIAIPYSYDAPSSYVKTNIDGTLNLLEASRIKNVKKFIHISSSEVYGTAQYVPIDEKHPLVGQSPYSATKIAADQLAYSFFCSFNLPLTIIRPFNTFGPRQSQRAIIPTIIAQLLQKNKKIKLGNIQTTRDFTYVEDTIRGIYMAINNDKCIGETINLGTGFEISIEKLSKLLIKISNQDVSIISEKIRKRPSKSEVDRLLSNNQKAKKILKWSPIFIGNEGLMKGLQDTYNWFLENEKLIKSESTNYVK